MEAGGVGPGLEARSQEILLVLSRHASGHVALLAASLTLLVKVAGSLEAPDSLGDVVAEVEMLTGGARSDTRNVVDSEMVPEAVCLLSHPVVNIDKGDTIHSIVSSSALAVALIRRGGTSATRINADTRIKHLGNFVQLGNQGAMETSYVAVNTLTLDHVAKCEQGSHEKGKEEESLGHKK